jgi:xylulokinase
MKYLLAHDLGTSGNKVTLFSTDGEKVASELYSYDTKWYNDVWAEQNPEDWYEAVKETTKKVVRNVDPRDVLGLSFSAQMMGCLCVDREGRALHPSIIWADMRGTDEEAFIRERIPAEEFYRITGHRPSASYGLAKLLWLKNHHPHVYDECYKMLNAKDYVIQRLTGEFVTDYSDASGTNLLDINTLRWSERIADAVDVDLEKMPELRKSTDIIGSLSEEAASELGLTSATKVICGGGRRFHVRRRGPLHRAGRRLLYPGNLVLERHKLDRSGVRSRNENLQLGPHRTGSLCPLRYHAGGRGFPELAAGPAGPYRGSPEPGSRRHRLQTA